jgi:hypothetical protein
VQEHVAVVPALAGRPRLAEGRSYLIGWDTAARRRGLKVCVAREVDK